MKAIVITFNGEISNEQELVREIGTLLVKSQNISTVIPALQLTVLTDKDVNALLINKALETKKLVLNEENKPNEFEVLLKNIIKIVGSPRLKRNQPYKKEILNKIPFHCELANAKAWAHLRNLTDYEKALLKEYSLEDLTSYIDGISDILRIYGYGKI